MTKSELAQRMTRDAKAFYKRYTAGERLSDEDRNLMTAFGVFLCNEYGYENTSGNPANAGTELRPRGESE